MTILIDENPLAASNAFPVDHSIFQNRPAWISPQRKILPPEVTAYRLRFHLPDGGTLRAHVSADERYLFFVDGQLIGRGPERGSERAWFYETYDLELSAGQHMLAALVWRLGEIGPLAQIGIRGGFLVEAETPHGDLVSTRSAPWECRPVNGIRFDRPETNGNLVGPWFIQPTQTTDGTHYPWGIESGNGEGWEPTVKRQEDTGFYVGIQAAHVLYPAMLPPQMASVRSPGIVRHVAAGDWENVQVIQVDAGAHLPAEGRSWQALVDHSAPLTVPPHTRRQVILDLEDYVCAYTQITLSGGKDSRVTIGWAEALHLDSSGKRKGRRDEIAGRTFLALSRDVTLADGGTQRTFEPLWWRAGRYIAILVETQDQPLTLGAFDLLESRYPLEMESRFNSSDPRLAAVIPIALRALQMCSHETYMDCPYYEQMMYVGDTRLEALTTYVTSADSRLPRKAIHLFGLSRLPSGLTQARYPGRDIEIIPPFSLWWIGMVFDYALWRGDRTFIASQLPGVRAVLDGFLKYLEPNHLTRVPDGWNFVDWVGDWPIGVPPDGFSGISGLINWHLVYTLGLAIQLEEWAGEKLLAQRWQAQRDSIAAAVSAAFWDEARGLFTDDLAHTQYSEHTQCLALLSGMLAGDQFTRTGDNLLSDPQLARTTIYFTHYLFEAYRVLHKPEALFDRLALWFDLPSKGFKTTPEAPEPSRSDCHAWGAHPLYHYFATLLGIRPASFGFQCVEIAPMPGSLSHLAGTLVHPNGQIEADLDFEGSHVGGNLTLPAGTRGVFRFAGATVELLPGKQLIAL